LDRMVFAIKTRNTTTSPIMTFLSTDRLIYICSLEFEFFAMRRWPGLLA
jgi:hypothetical protein